MWWRFNHSSTTWSWQLREENSIINFFTQKIKILFDEVGLIGVWREFFLIRDYTHYSAPHSFYTRIEYFLTFGKDKDTIQTCRVGKIDISDNAPIYLSVDLNLHLKNTTLKLNSSLLNDTQIKDQIRNEINSYLEFNDNEEVTTPILWDTLQTVIKIIVIVAHKKKMRNKKNKKQKQRIYKIGERN